MAKNPRLIDLTGQRFGRWTVLRQAGNSPRGAALWHAVCDCGNSGTPMGGDLRHGKSRSCGCLQREAGGLNNLTHGGSGTRLHRIWKGIKGRCGANEVYRHVTICPQWQEFSAFAEWAKSSGYEEWLTIDRIDNEKGYEPSNCRWATKETQSQNRRFVHRAPDGRAWSAIAKEHGITTMLMHGRVHEGWPIEMAATLPRGTQYKRSL